MMNLKNKSASMLLLAAVVLIPSGFISSATAGLAPPFETLLVPIESGTDDAEEHTATGTMYLKSSDLELIQEVTAPQKVGLRFALEIPSGAIIESATIQFTTDETKSVDTTLAVYGEAIANALTFSNANFDISNRTLTTVNVPWSPPPWTIIGEAGPDQQTPDLATIVQEIVNLEGWVQGNSIAIIISGTGTRVAESFNGTAPPVLHVTFSIEPPANQAPDAIDDGAPGSPILLT